MKKIILVVVLFLSCYIVYENTDNDNLVFLSLGDGLAKEINNGIDGYSYYLKEYLDNNNKLGDFNDLFTNSDYRIMDLVRMIKYNNYVYDEKEIYINQVLKRADIITLSVGMNEIYYKLLINNNNIYDYIHEMLDDMSMLLEYINKYNHKLVIVTGYYNITDSNQDIFNYINYELRQLVENENFVFVDLDKIFRNNCNYFTNSVSFYPNSLGYYKIYQIILEKIKNS